MPPTIRCMGTRKASFFHGYYECYCYLPLYIFCGRQLLGVKLRRSNMDAAAGAVEEVARIVAQIRSRWPRTRILLRGDSGFTREPLMAWCETNRVDYVFGLARNDRLEQAITPELISATIESIRTGKTARRFKDFSYATLSSWSGERVLSDPIPAGKASYGARRIRATMSAFRWPAEPLRAPIMRRRRHG